MKKFLIGLVIETIFDMLILALTKQAKKSSSTVDDQVVEIIADNRDSLIADIKKAL